MIYVSGEHYVLGKPWTEWSELERTEILNRIKTAWTEYCDIKGTLELNEDDKSRRLALVWTAPTQDACTQTPIGSDSEDGREAKRPRTAGDEHTLDEELEQEAARS